MNAQEINRMITVGDEVRELVRSHAWREYIEPVFDRMVVDVLGGKMDGRWMNGSLDDKALSERRLRELQAYKAGIVAVHQAIYRMIDEAEAARHLLAEASKISEEYNYYENR